MKFLVVFFILMTLEAQSQTRLEDCSNECCRKSIEKAQSNNYPIKTSDFCPNGTIEKFLQCEGSVTWCEPLFKKPSAKE